MHDVAIIGAGVTGCALAYTLSSYEISVLLLEKENDVAMGATRANTAIIHAGFDPEPHSFMGKLNVEGNRACYALCEALDVEHRRTGSWVVAFDKEQRDALDVLHQQGIENGCKGLEIVSGDEARKENPTSPLKSLGPFGRRRQGSSIPGNLRSPWPRWRCETASASCPTRK